MAIWMGRVTPTGVDRWQAPGEMSPGHQPIVAVHAQISPHLRLELDGVFFGPTQFRTWLKNWQTTRRGPPIDLLQLGGLMAKANSLATPMEVDRLILSGDR